MVQTTDISSHAKWEFNCRQFLRIMGPSVPPYAKEKKKSPPFFFPLSPHCNPKLPQNIVRGFRLKPVQKWGSSWELPAE